jgi:uncharacterized membrane protein
MIFIGSAGIGVALAIPVTSWITAYYLVSRRSEASDRIER